MDNGSSSIDQKFISKVQYKTFEKGEYDAVKRRNLSQVLELIDQFPWDEQRALTDVQLTCPSVTILNDQKEYLKIGVYFNNKFTAYFLNYGHHLYERHLPTMADVHETVTAFFNNNLPMDQFERDYLTFGAIYHLENKAFEYRVKTVRLSFLYGFMLIYFISFFTTLFSVAATFNSWFAIFPLIIFCVIGFATRQGIMDLYASRNMYLQLSKGHDAFVFGQNEQSIAVYNKSDVKEVVINVGGRRGKRASYQIIFNDESSINFSSILIPFYDFITKFPERLVRQESDSYWG